MKQRILRYANLHNSLPNSINDLPEIPDKISRVQDAWGRDILMSFSDGKATLTSLGRDGKPGGTRGRRRYVRRVSAQGQKWCVVQGRCGLDSGTATLKSHDKVEQSAEHATRWLNLGAAGRIAGSSSL